MAEICDGMYQATCEVDTGLPLQVLGETSRMSATATGLTQNEFFQNALQMRLLRVRETVSRPEHGGWFRPASVHVLQVVSGRFDLQHPESRRRHLQAGEAVIVTPGVRYFIRVVGAAAPIRYAHLEPTLFGTLPLDDIAVLPAVLPPPDGRRLGDAIAALANKSDKTSGSVLATLSADGLARANLMYELLRHALLIGGAETRLTGAVRLAPVLQYMRQHLHEDLDRERLATIAGMSPSRLAALFHASLGLPPMRFLQRLRLQRARVMLAESDRTIKEVAEFLRFTDAFHLSKRFKSAYGYSPSQFRRQTEVGDH